MTCGSSSPPTSAASLPSCAPLLAPLGIELVAQGELGIAEAEEPHRTFVENALAKARHAGAQRAAGARRRLRPVRRRARRRARACARRASPSRSAATRRARTTPSYVAAARARRDETGARTMSACWCACARRRPGAADRRRPLARRDPRASARGARRLRLRPAVLHAGARPAPSPSSRAEEKNAHQPPRHGIAHPGAAAAAHGADPATSSRT